MNKSFPVIILCLAVIFFGIWLAASVPQDKIVKATSFEECVAAGGTVMESFPRQCKMGDDTFTENNVGNEVEKADLIRIISVRPNAVVSSPLTITGEARGTWFFEASFPVELRDASGKIVARGIAQAKGDWMTTDFVPFEATLTFNLPQNANGGSDTLILRKDNPSGLPENEDALVIPVVISQENSNMLPTPPVACSMEAKLCPDGSYVGRSGPKCEFAVCPGTPPITGGNIASINQTIPGGGVYITPLQVVSDSRCPANVNCIWAGEVVVKVKLEKDGVTKEVELKEGGSVVFTGKTISLVSVSPEKKEGVTIAPKDYRFTFRVN